MLDVLLVYPRTEAAPGGPEIDTDPGRSLPLGLCCIASSVEAHGHSAAILDARLYTTDDVLAALRAHVSEGVRWLGFSVMTCQVPHALALSKVAKEASRDISVVWGGAHPTLFPEQTVRHPAVDWVVIGEGEQVFPRLLAGLPASVDEMIGLATADGDDVKCGGRAPLVDPEDFPIPAYHLLEIHRYMDRTLPTGARARGIDVLTSRGCPYRCSFCPNSFILGRRWRPLTVEHVSGQLEVLRRLEGLETVWFADDYFFGSIERATAIADRLHAGDPTLGWEANIRPDLLRAERVDGALLAHLKATGCHTLRMGAESGSDRVLEILRKDITVEDIRRGVSLCDAAGIVPLCFFMMGIPGESRKDVTLTLALMGELAARYPLVVPCGPGVFRPYPGGELYDACLDLGLREPPSLEEWGTYTLSEGYLDPSDLPWVPDPSLLADVPFYMFHIQERHNLAAYSFPQMRRLMAGLSSARARTRLWWLRWEPHAARMLTSVTRRAGHSQLMQSRAPRAR